MPGVGIATPTTRNAISRNVAWKGRSMRNARWLRWKPSAMRSQIASDCRPIFARCGTGARSTASPPEKACRMRPRGSASQRGARASSRLEPSDHAARVRMQRSEEAEEAHGPHEEDTAAQLDQIHGAQPEAPSGEYDWTLSLGGGDWEYEEVQGEQGEHRDEVDEPLEDDRGEPGGRRDRVAARDEPGPQAARPRAGRGGPRRTRPSSRRRGPRNPPAPAGRADPPNARPEPRRWPR